MNYKLFFEIVLAGSSLSLGGMIAKKIPELTALDEQALKDEEITFSAVERLRALQPFKKLSFDNLSQKVLTKVRIISLKTDHKTASLLQKIRENSQKKKIMEDDDYWDQIKKATKG